MLEGSCAQVVYCGTSCMKSDYMLYECYNI